jgi:Oligosaccharyltransferase 48 kDa subunit beta
MVRWRRALLRRICEEIAPFVRVTVPPFLCGSPQNAIFSRCSGEKSGNEQLVHDIATWTFQENLVLRIDSTTHHLVNETVPREHYTVNDNIVCSSFQIN